MKPISIMALQKIPKIGQKTIEKALSISDFEPSNEFDLIEVLKKAKERDGRIHVPDVQSTKDAWNKSHEIWDISQQQNIQIIPRGDPNYPKYLSHISDPPVLLHVRGNVDALNKGCITIIGTREPTEYGIDAAKRLGALFADKGYVMVSGLADGIDAAAHQGALEVNGITVAVLAHGLDTVYPIKNKELADAILKNNGALISEHPWGTKANRSYFIARDRIQSGLSLGVFIIETAVKGGTMHTVKFCKEQKRSLIVLKHPPDLIDDQKVSGNIKLISEKQADIVFKDNDNIDLVINEMALTKKELLDENKKKNHSSTIQTKLWGIEE